MNPIKKTFQYGEHQVTLETGEIARQANGAVIVSMSSQCNYRLGESHLISQKSVARTVVK